MAKKSKRSKKAIHAERMRNLAKAHRVRSGLAGAFSKKPKGKRKAVGYLRKTYNQKKGEYHRAGEALYIAEHGHSIRAGKRKRKKTGHRKSR